MNNTIGFENFRKFANFPEIDLGDITILVGGNNSGKSTLVKALLLCVDNIRTMKMSDNGSLFNRIPRFSFASNDFNHDVHIQTFARAFNNKNIGLCDIVEGDNGKDIFIKSPEQITFKFTIGWFAFKLIVSGNIDSDDTFGKVDLIRIEDKEQSRAYEVNYRDNLMTYDILSNKENENIVGGERLWKAYTAILNELNKAEKNSDLKKITDLNKAKDNIISLFRILFTGYIDEDDNFDVEEFMQWENIRKNLLKIYPNTIKTSYTAPLEDHFDSIEDVNYDKELVALNVIRKIIDFANCTENEPCHKEGTDPDLFSLEMANFNIRKKNRTDIKQDERIIRNSLKGLKFLLSVLDIEYIPAHYANQNTIYDPNDKNDFIAQTIHEFYKAKISKGDPAYEFLKKWLVEFEIGQGIKINNIDGEGYGLKIIDEPTDEVVLLYDNKTFLLELNRLLSTKKIEEGVNVEEIIKELKNKYYSGINLADKGMGTIQLVILLLKLAIFIKKYGLSPLYPDSTIGYFSSEGKARKFVGIFIVLEEPEQNMHPKLQSKLADLFNDLTYYKCQLIVETHSEYLIRRSQVIVAEAEYENEEELKKKNPFKVYYLPQDEDPYEMKYGLNGRFDHKFGAGFFDEAGGMALTISKIERRKR